MLESKGQRERKVFVSISFSFNLFSSKSCKKSVIINYKILGLSEAFCSGSGSVFEDF